MSELRCLRPRSLRAATYVGGLRSLVKRTGGSARDVVRYECVPNPANSPDALAGTRCVAGHEDNLQDDRDARVPVGPGHYGCCLQWAKRGGERD